MALVSAVAGVGGLVATPAHAAAEIHVPSGQPTIQAGIDAASNGDTVVVAPGTYVENIDFKAKAIEVRGSGPQTVIDGGGAGHVVVFKSDEGRTSVLWGFTITNGAIVDGSDLLTGAEIAIFDSSPSITGNVITGNHAGDRLGGGVGATGGAALIEDNHIHHNSAGADGAGGGIFAGAAVEIVTNVIEGNTSGGGGGVTI